MRRRWSAGLGALLVLLLVLPGAALGQVAIGGVPTSGEETLTVGAAAKGITANLCGPGNTRGALIQVKGAAIYFSLHAATATPDSNDFEASAGTFVAVRPASQLRMIRQAGDATVKVQCFE
jgi:hypothetical protein